MTTQEIEMLKIHSTKAFVNLACAHAQWFDKEADGSPGGCASIHGYDRTVKLTFSGKVDENGWLYPFGELKPIREFIEYYFDHTTVLPANDPRLSLVSSSFFNSGMFATLRILPYGVSMEMSSLFIWEHVNPYILKQTSGRVHISKVESIEHERNAAYIEVGEDVAKNQSRSYAREWDNEYLPKKDRWANVYPKNIIDLINNK